MQDLGTLPGGNLSQAYAINDAGEVVGYSQTPGGQLRAFVWTASAGMQDIGTLPGGSNAVANGINNAGWVVGWSDTQ